MGVRLLVGSAILLSLLALPARAGEGRIDAAAAAIDAASAKRHAAFLAGDRLEGRAPGSAGGRAAGAYIARRLAACGLEPGGEGAGEAAYFQEFKAGGRTCRNVIALRRGRGGPDRAEHVLIGAHYDHLGHGEAGAISSLRSLFGTREPAEIYNGADDNASGTAALLEIAGAVAALDPPPERSIVLVFFDAEEMGLRGSLHYAAHPRLPLERCAGMINMDMVGRARGGRVELLGATSGTGLPEIVIAENAAIGLDVEVDPYMVPNSDHFPFYGAKVPVAFFCTGLHRDYHRPTDDVHELNAGDLARIARLAFRTAARLADAPARPVFAEVPGLPIGAMALEMLDALTGADVFRGIQRDAYGPIAGAFVHGAPGGGLSVDYVMPRSPLATAGLRRGDRVERLDGRPLEWPAARLRLLTAVRRGGHLALDVARHGERLAIEFDLDRGAGGKALEKHLSRRKAAVLF